MGSLGVSTALMAILGPRISWAAIGETQNDEIDRRIQQVRTASLEIRLLDQQGQPIANQRVKIEHLRHLFNFGAAYQGDLNPPNRSTENESDRRHREYFLQLFNAATITFYWRSYEPQEGQYADASLLEQIALLKQYHFYLRGHPLFWNHNPACLPTWLENRQLTSQEVRSHMDRLLKHLSEVIFPQLDEVDVFNELVRWDSHEHPFTDLFQEQGKIPMVKEYLTQFKTLNPKVKAVINDYVSSPDYAEMLKEFQENDVPFDQIGQQAHQFLFRANWSSQRLSNIIDRLVALDKPLVFTEISVLSGANKQDIDFSRIYTDWKSDPENEQKQADYLEFFYRFAFSYPQIAGVFLWSFSDRGSWLGAPTGILYPDGNPKPAFTRLNRLINQTWRTNVELSTDHNGYASIPHAYEGEYRIIIDDRSMMGKHTQRNPLRQTYSLSRG
jgi:endo-1,4-beta-xylanase